MCRGYEESESEKLRIRAFYTHLSVSRSKNKNAASVPPDFLTLHFLPRINGSLLEVSGSRIRPDSPAFVTLHRVISEDTKYGSRERVTVCEGARFEIYASDLKLLKGIFRKDDADNWRMDCKGVASAAAMGVEVTVAAEGLAGVMSEKVEVEVAAAGFQRRRRRKGRCCELEEIPEVREEGTGSGACCCSECGGGGGEAVDGGGDCEMEVDAEAVGWAVDVGIWAVCIGVGYLVSASSYKRLRRKIFI